MDLPLPSSPREGSGPAFVAARTAVESAKSGPAHVITCPLAVRSRTITWSDPPCCASAERNTISDGFKSAAAG